LPGVGLARVLFVPNEFAAPHAAVAMLTLSMIHGSIRKPLSLLSGNEVLQV